MARNAAAQTAFGPMVLAAIEQHEPPGQRLVDDDLAAKFLPARMRWLVAATQPAFVRRMLVAGMDRGGPGLWSNLACRKRYIADKLREALDGIDAVVVLGAGLDTRAYHLAQTSHIPVFEVDQPVNITRKAATVRRVLGALPRSVRLVSVDFERDDLLTTLAELGYRTDYRTFFIWEGVTQYLTADAVRSTLDGLRPVAPGSRLVFTYVRRDFIDGVNLYGARSLYRRVRQRQQLWHFGIQPEEIPGFLDEFGWRLVEQIGPDEIVERYVKPTGRNLSASQVEWTAYAEKR
ncbi:SAM-dependent methyltransferase [Mycobacterium branderi]|uniref:S-adenosyl-L-methionine-dependent methyltransferase n=1 Tax=Mycobacterium branderi TaxID=43348 RepID=A0A7I7WBV6_9MYCO|nr:SAM-dependent methyltransferase [Mycobacterium branderi]MCV7232358.1 SAM-dependent methyltransferase [Mycobacterium branderi]ORA36067.1 SAM-dependent methyltransferase [Mycobacterium branderi]BBZ14382.1 S-adenosyl-L-methionine-dependent methyltransferase [Mycobacterium branderi]